MTHVHWNQGLLTPEAALSRFVAACTSAGAIALTWSSRTLEIVALASRAFAFYYLLQCLVAISVSKSPIQPAGMAIVAVAPGFVTVFAVPAS